MLENIKINKEFTEKFESEGMRARDLWDILASEIYEVPIINGGWNDRWKKVEMRALTEDYYIQKYTPNPGDDNIYYYIFKKVDLFLMTNHVIKNI